MLIIIRLAPVSEHWKAGNSARHRNQRVKDTRKAHIIPSRVSCVQTHTGSGSQCWLSEHALTQSMLLVDNADQI